jgi:hypothetical protein
MSKSSFSARRCTLPVISPLEGEMSAKLTEGGWSGQAYSMGDVIPWGSPPSALPGISPSRGEIDMRHAPHAHAAGFETGEAA